ncbi:MAG: hypothetical protein ABI142_06300 [Bryocella sp.]
MPTMTIVARLLPVLLCGTAFAFGQSAPEQTLEQSLKSVRYDLQVSQQNELSGSGLPVLSKAVDSAQFVLIGEDHLTMEIPQFVAAVCDLMAPGGLNAMAVEAGPQAAKFVDDSFGKPDRVARIAKLIKQYPDSVAFLNARQENDLAAHCAHASHQSDFQLWGLDQEFLGATGWLLDGILATHPGREAAKAVQHLQIKADQDRVAAAKTGDPSKLFLLQPVDESDLSKTEELLRKQGTPEANSLFRELLVSHKIYRANVEGRHESNSMRAQLLKENLRNNLDKEYAKRMHPRVLLKFGDWHLYKGFNPLHQLDLGDYVAEIADGQGASTLHICILGARGVHALYAGYGRPPALQPFVMDEDRDYRWIKPAMDSQVSSGWTMYDLRKMRFQKIAGLDPDFSRLIYGYDLLIIVPELHPADMIN